TTMTMREPGIVVSERGGRATVHGFAEVSCAPPGQVRSRWSRTKRVCGPIWLTAVEGVSSPGLKTKGAPHARRTLPDPLTLGHRAAIWPHEAACGGKPEARG